MEKITKTAKEMAEDVKNSYGDSHWLKYAVETGMKRDPVDALADAEYLVKILKQNLTEVQGG